MKLWKWRKESNKKLKKTKNINFSFLLVVIIFFVFFLWLIFGNIDIRFWKNSNLVFSWTDYSGYEIENITWSLYLSPNNTFEPFLESLEWNENIEIQIYDFTQKEIKEKFHDLLKKWTNISMIMENYKYNQYVNTWNQVQDEFGIYSGFSIENDNKMWTNYIHSKIVLLDNGFWIQSANLTQSSFFSNREHFFYSENKEILENLKYIFQKDFVGEQIYEKEIHPNLLICNINCRDWIEELLESAKKSIKIQTQYIVDPAIQNILKNKSDLDIKIMLANTDNNYDIMKYFGPLKARYIDDFYVHTKTILIDDEVLLIWSMNLSDNSLDNNREIWILITNNDIIREYLQWFEEDRKISKAYKWF